MSDGCGQRDNQILGRYRVPAGPWILHFFWIHSFGCTLLDTLFWIHSLGHTLLVTLFWIHSFEWTLLDTLFWIRPFGDALFGPICGLGVYKCHR